MKIIICIISVLICLFIGNRLANLDKPMPLEWEEAKDDSTLTISIPWLTVSVPDEDIWIRIAGFKSIILAFPDGHEEAIELQALLGAGTLKAYFEEVK